MGSIPKSRTTVLESALKEAQNSYLTSHPVSKKSFDEACQYMPGGNTRTVLHISPFPLTIQSAEACYLTSVDGQQYIDFLGEYTAGIYGHNHPAIRRAIEQALDSGWNYGAPSQMERTLAQIVCERFPTKDLVRFVNSGTEANMMALATAVAYTGRKKVVIFDQGYHGSTISGKTVPGKSSINLPYDFVVGNYNNVEATVALIDQLPEETLAAILVEPMLGSGGCFKGRPEFLRALRDIATQHHALLIFDEVMTSRLAIHGYGAQLGVTPDIMTLGKWVGGGMSFGAFGGRADVMSLFDPRENKLQHPGTFNNNVFSMSAGIVGCRLLDESKLSQLNLLGENMRMKIEQVFQKYRINGQIPVAPIMEDIQTVEVDHRPPKMFITGVGSLMNIHFAGLESSLLQEMLFHHMLGHGIYMAQRGFIALNLEINQSHVDRFVQAIDNFCQRWQASLQW